MHRQLLPGTAGTTGRLLARKRQRLKRLMNARTASITGRQVFFAEYVAKSKLHNKDTDAKPWNQQRVMKAHGVEWERLSVHKKRQYEDRASLLRYVRSKSVGEEVADVTSELVAAEHDDGEHENDDWMLRGCRFTSEQCAQLDVLYHSELNNALTQPCARSHSRRRRSLG
eukprot:6492283-Amphidinium_carterae.3